MKHIDLNLLRVLETLLEERSVTRAGERLGLTQPAVSHALRRLRALIGDPLFIRRQSGLEPTERMRAIAPALREGLAMLRDTLSVPTFAAETSDRRFTVAAQSYVCATVIPALIERFAALAPEARLRIRTLPDDLSARIAAREIDLAIGSFEALPAPLRRQSLFQEQAVWVVAASHPLAGTTPSIAALRGLRQVVVNTAADAEGVHGQISSGGVHRRVTIDFGEHLGVANRSPPGAVATVYDVRTALSVVARTPLAALLPRRVALAEAAAAGLVVLDTPYGGKPIDIAMVWHRDLGDEPPLAWLRGLVAEATDALA